MPTDDTNATQIPTVPLIEIDGRLQDRGVTINQDECIATDSLLGKHMQSMETTQAVGEYAAKGSVTTLVGGFGTLVSLAPLPAKMIGVAIMGIAGYMGYKTVTEQTGRFAVQDVKDSADWKMLCEHVPNAKPDVEEGMRHPRPRG